MRLKSITTVQLSNGEFQTTVLYQVGAVAQRRIFMDRVLKQSMMEAVLHVRRMEDQYGPMQQAALRCDLHLGAGRG